MTPRRWRQFRDLVTWHRLPSPLRRRQIHRQIHFLFGSRSPTQVLISMPRRVDVIQTTANRQTRSRIVPVPARLSKNAGSTDTGNNRLLLISLHFRRLDSLPRHPHRCCTCDLQTNKRTGTWHRPRGDQRRSRGIHLVGSTRQVHPECVQLPKGALKTTRAGGIG